MSFFHIFLIFVSAIAGGLVNALAGGGTLITFPILTFIGIPVVAANVTNTVALCPGYFGATIAQLKEIRNQSKRLWMLLPAAVAGGLLGGFLLLNTGEKLFREAVPFLILLASGLLAMQEPLKKILLKKSGSNVNSNKETGLSSIPIGLASIYGGYFGAGLSVIILAVLGLSYDDNLTKLNALKQVISFSVNIAAAAFFLFSGLVVWNAAIIMAIGALLGGALGGKLAGKISPAVLRLVVVIIGFIVGVYYLI